MHMTYIQEVNLTKNLFDTTIHTYIKFLYLHQTYIKKHCNIEHCKAIMNLFIFNCKILDKFNKL